MWAQKNETLLKTISFRDTTESFCTSIFVLQFDYFLNIQKPPSTFSNYPVNSEVGDCMFNLLYFFLRKIKHLSLINIRYNNIAKHFL